MTRYSTDEYIILTIYISGIVHGKVEVIEITAEVHLVRNLKVKLLISVDILDAEGMNLSFSNQTLTITDEEG